MKRSVDVIFPCAIKTVLPILAGQNETSGTKIKKKTGIVFYAYI